MNTETKVEEKEVEETVEEKVVAPSPTELAAREGGWVSKEEWVAQGKDADDWRSAKEFQERGELFEEINKLKDSNKKTAAAFKVLVEHHKKVREVAVKEALDKLKAEKKEALQNQDIDRVYLLDDEIEKVRSAPVDVPNVEIPQAEAGPTLVFKKWHRQNSWYQLDGDDEASRHADMFAARERSKDSGISEEDLLRKVESNVAKRFPELFANPNASRTAEVNSRSERKESSDSFKLTDAEELVCKMLVRDGVMTRKAYVDEIKKVREA